MVLPIVDHRKSKKSTVWRQIQNNPVISHVVPTLSIGLSENRLPDPKKLIGNPNID